MDMSNLWPLDFLQKILNAVERFGRVIAIISAIVLWLNGIMQSCLESLFESYIALSERFKPSSPMVAGRTGRFPCPLSSGSAISTRFCRCPNTSA